MIDKIVDDDHKSVEGSVLEFEDSKKKFKKSFLGYAGIVVGVFLVFVVIVMTMTDIQITSINDFEEIAIQFFALLFVSYQMYVNTVDSGSRAGLETKTYITSKSTYNKLRDEIIDQGLQGLLPKFCADYIRRELEHTRTVILANIGMSYEDFIPYLLAGKDDVKKDAKLSKAQKKAIIKAIKVSPIKLTPEMIMHGGYGRRSPLGMNPKDKKTINFIFKFVTSAFISLFFGLLAIKFVREPTIEMAVYIITRLVPVILNGVGGYIFGYENIIVDTVGFMDNQSAIIEEFKKFAEKTKGIKCDNN